MSDTTENDSTAPTFRSLIEIDNTHQTPNEFLSTAGHSVLVTSVIRVGSIDATNEGAVQEAYTRVWTAICLFSAGEPASKSQFQWESQAKIDSLFIPETPVCYKDTPEWAAFMAWFTEMKGEKASASAGTRVPDQVLSAQYEREWTPEEAQANAQYQQSQQSAASTYSNSQSGLTSVGPRHKATCITRIYPMVMEIKGPSVSQLKSLRRQSAAQCILYLMSSNRLCGTSLGLTLVNAEMTRLVLLQGEGEERIVVVEDTRGTDDGSLMGLTDFFRDVSPTQSLGRASQSFDIDHTVLGNLLGFVHLAVEQIATQPLDGLRRLEDLSSTNSVNNLRHNAHLELHREGVVEALASEARPEFKSSPKKSPSPLRGTKRDRSPDDDDRNYDQPGPSKRTGGVRESKENRTPPGEESTSDERGEGEDSAPADGEDLDRDGDGIRPEDSISVREERQDETSDSESGANDLSSDEWVDLVCKVARDSKVHVMLVTSKTTSEIVKEQIIARSQKQETN